MTFSAPFFAMFIALCLAGGVDIYALITGVGLVSVVDPLSVPPQLEFLLRPEIIWGAAFLYLVDFMVDKIPWMNSLWDLLHTVVRLPATVYIAIHALGDHQLTKCTLIGIIALLISATAHFTTVAIRLVINRFPAAVNIFASISEDLSVVLIVFLAWEFPLVFLLLISLLVFGLFRLVPFLGRNVKEALSCCGTDSERISIIDLLRA